MSIQSKGDDPATSAKYRAPALDRGLDILETLASHSAGLTRTELVRALDVSASQIYRMLERLVARGYVTRVEGGDRYALSMKLFLLATEHPPLRRLVAHAQPKMDQFAVDMQQSCHLVVPQHGAAVIIAQASPTSHWEFRARLGATMDLFETGSGNVLLAFQHSETLRETLGLWGIAYESVVDQLHHLQPELETVRQAGFRVSPSRQVVGITDLSAPVLGPSGQAVAVVTCAYLQKPQKPNGTQSKTLKTLLKLAQSLSLAT